MSSDRRRRAERVLDSIFRQLNEDRIRQLIDGPIDAVLDDFTSSLQQSGQNRTPSDVFSEFVRCVYADGLGAKWHIVNAEATSLSLLEDHYQGLWSDGYCAAALDATNSSLAGLDFVLAQLSEIIKTKERQEYVQAVFARQIDPCDWYLRCEIAEVLLDRYGPLLSPALLECPPSQLVDEIPALTIAIISSHTTTTKITT
ncbi:MAG: hypothetical protein ACYSWQ_00285 [Planctomycetota bacterium]